MTYAIILMNLSFGAIYLAFHNLKILVGNMHNKGERWDQVRYFPSYLVYIHTALMMFFLPISCLMAYNLAADIITRRDFGNFESAFWRGMILMAFTYLYHLIIICQAGYFRLSIKHPEERPQRRTILIISILVLVILAVLFSAFCTIMMTQS